MANQVKCRRCGATFSVTRSRCPNCGTRRVVQSARTPAGTPGTVRGTVANDRARSNAKWQLAFGLILVGAVILSVVVMVSSSLNGLDTGNVRATPTPAAELQEGALGPIVEAAPTPEPTPTPTVEAIRIYNYTNDITAEKAWPMLSLSRDGGNEQVKRYEMNITAQVIPMDIQNPVITWTVSDPDVLHIEPMADNPNGLVAWQEGTKAGGVQLTAECNGVTQTITIYCVD